MPDFWQFPTGSMGIGPISSIYQARFMRYLQHRGLLDTARSPGLGRVRRRRDGRAREHERADAGRAREARQPDLGRQLQPAAPGRPGARQRPHHRRAGGAVRRRRLARHQAGLGLATGTACSRATPAARWRAPSRDTVDGQFQTFAAKDGRYNREHFFGQNPELAALAQGLTDEQIDRLQARRPRPGEDPCRLRRGRAHARASRP